MFRNSGRKITVLAKVLFWLNLVLALGAAAAAVLYAYSTYGVEMALMASLVAVAVAVCYMLLVYVGLLMLHAFGELTQSNVEIRRILAENRRAPERPVYVPPVPERAPAPAVPERTPSPAAPAQEDAFPEWRDVDYPAVVRPASAAPFPVPEPVEKPQEPAPKAAPRTAAFGMVYCRRCGAKHEPGVAKCRYCGTPLY